MGRFVGPWQEAADEPHGQKTVQLLELWPEALT